MNIHPKTSAAAVGGSAGVLIAAILHSLSGVHLTPEVYAAIPTFLSTVLAYLAPGANRSTPKPASTPTVVPSAVNTPTASAPTPTSPAAPGTLSGGQLSQPQQ